MREKNINKQDQIKPTTTIALQAADLYNKLPLVHVNMLPNHLDTPEVLSITILKNYFKFDISSHFKFDFFFIFFLSK